MKKRTYIKKRISKETNIAVKLNIDGAGRAKIDTGIGFLNHMLELFSFWGYFDLEISAKGDTKVDLHHTNEDLGIALGDAFKEALGKNKIGIKRMGSAAAVMEEAVATIVVDISGRGFFKHIQKEPAIQSSSSIEEGYSFEYAEHFLQSFANRLGMNLHIKLSGTNSDLHADLEPVFKALGIALDSATQIDPRRRGIPSTKGLID